MTLTTSIQMGASILLALLTSAPAVGLEPGAVFHVVIVTDTTAASGLGGDVVRDGSLVAGAFRNNVPAQQLRIVKLPQKDLTPAGILKAIGELSVTPGRDVVVFYYSGHGAFIDRPNVGHFFSLPGGQTLTRSTLEAKIAARKPLVAATITDCCAVGMRLPGALHDATPVEVPQAVSPLFQHLFLDRRGLFSIASSKPGEYSLTRGDGKGSLFTKPFCEYLLTNKNQRLVWDRVLADVAQQVDRDFQEREAERKNRGISLKDQQGQELSLVLKDKAGAVLKDANGQPVPQTTQTVYAYRITPRLGTFMDLGDCLKVTHVVPLSPAAVAGLQKDDMVVEINGVALHSLQDYSDAVDKSPETMWLKIRRQAEGKTVEVEKATKLNPD